MSQQTMRTRAGGQLAFQTFGDPTGETVVFIRGTGAAGDRWMPQVEAFQKHYHCVIFDNRGTGASDAPPPPYTVGDLADDTFDLMDHLEIPAAHLCGSSLGGAVALAMAARHPSRVRTLQLHSSWLVTDGYASYSLRLLRTFLETGGVNFYYEATIPLLFSPTFLTNDFEKIETILAGMRAHAASPSGLIGQIDANLTHDGRSDASAVTQPTLVTVGELDLLLPVAESRRLHEAIPNSHMHVFPGGGHLVSMESAHDFNTVTLTWLASVAK